MARVTRTFHIGGMHCMSCQNRIYKGLKNLPGIEDVSVSYRSGTAKLRFDPDIIDTGRIAKAVGDLGYELLPDGRGSFARTLCLPIIIVALYILLEQTGLLNLLVPTRLAEGGMGYGMLFVVGLLTSVHCIAMCGGINLSQCIPAEAAQKSVLRPSLMYNMGRVVSYTAIGFLLGLVGMLAGGGASAGVPALVQGILKLAAGLMMVIMGVNMLGIFPWLRRINLHMPRFIAARIGSEKARARRPFIIGLLNGLMPCGPLQSMQILALASGNPVSGALSMLAFSLGTVPLMLGLGTIVSALGKRFSRVVMNVGAVLVAVLGLAMLSQGGSLSGVLSPGRLQFIIIGLFAVGIAASIPFSKKLYRAACAAAAAVLVAAACLLLQPAASAPSPEADTIVSGVQEVESTLLPWEYPTITVQAGVPVEWNIHAPEGSINGCNYRMLIPEYGIGLTFEEGDNIIRFTPEEPGEFYYSCWMGMIRGSIIVV